MFDLEFRSGNCIPEFEGVLWRILALIYAFYPSVATNSQRLWEIGDEKSLLRRNEGFKAENFETLASIDDMQK